MTSNGVPPPGAPAGRRRALGRGPGTAPPEVATLPEAETPEPDTAEPEAETREPETAEPEAPEREAVEPAAPAGPEAADPEVAEPAPSGVPKRQVAEPAAPAPEVAALAAAEAAEPAASAVPRSGVAEPAAARVAESEAVEPAAPVAPKAAEPPVPAGTGSPDGVFKVRLANFEGPFDLLLQLISKHKLDVTEIALSKVTDEFMAHIRAMGPDWDLDRTTEFLVVAATLLDLKAARLLPAAEVEDEGDLALLEARDLLFARLLQYRAYKRIADIFSGRLDDESRRHPRTVGLEPEHAELLPEVVISIGPEGFARLAVRAMQPKPKPQVYVDHIHAPLVSVREQAGIVVARLRELGEASFRALVEDTDDTLTVVARFLALLELYREKAVALEQEAALGELLVRWTGGDGDGAPRVTDEFDRPPQEPGKEKKA
ncbi:segregation and condensation protein A [Streptomyces bungoensis]|uniref:segregation and condensation protein A n=1 Tax=Streptomyces bungoensis TaxID=285568 RepID=UPI0034270B25